MTSTDARPPQSGMGGGQESGLGNGTGRKPSAPARLRRALRGFKRREDGASAVEFALVAPVFLFTIFAMLETFTVYWADRVLQSYVADLARSHRTGFNGTISETDAAGNTTTRQEDLCRDRVANYLFNCSEMLVDVRPTEDVVPLRTSGGEVDPSLLVIDPGDSGSVNIVRVFYKWPRLIGVPITPGGQALPSGEVELYASKGFVRE